MKSGTVEFITAFGKTVVESVDETQEERPVGRKLPDAVLKRREEQRMLAILDSDEEVEAFAAPPAKRRVMATELSTKQSLIETGA